MGLLSWLNRSGNEILSPTVVDPGSKRTERALERGAAAGATIVGIERKLDDGTTTRFVAVAVPTANGTRTGGVQVLHGPAHVLARLRLGVEVLVRHSDGDAVVLDWPAMCARWGVSDEPAQKRRRKPPAEGVTDKAGSEAGPVAGAAGRPAAGRQRGRDPRPVVPERNSARPAASSLAMGNT